MTAEPRDGRSGEAGPASGSFGEFVAELRRRRVIRVALVYLVAAWVIAQVAQVVFPPLLLPAWTVTLVIVLLVLGFPVALILAWAYQVERDHTDPAATQVHYVVDKHRKLDFVIIAALSAVVVILGYELYVRESAGTAPVAAPVAAPSPAAAVSRRPSVAVLPFVNLSDDPANEYFADGLAEEILNLLVRIREVDVTARTSSFFFKGKDVDIGTIARHLGVTNVLEGSVRRSDNRIRVTAQLINAETAFHLWSATYDRELTDIFGIQDDIARHVATALELVLSSDSDAALQRVATGNIEAYQYYLQGRDYLRDEYTDARIASARSLFEQALQLDAGFAEAYAGLCDTYLVQYDRNRAAADFESAERACHRALTLDAGAIDVHAALGNLYLASGQYDKAKSELELALAQNGMNADIHFALGDVYTQQGRLAEAEATFRRVIEMQPGYWRGYLRLGNFYFKSNRIAESVGMFARAVSLAPDVATGYLNLGTAYYLLGDFEDAASAWTRSLELEPTRTAYMNVGSSYFFLGRFDDAVRMYLKASELAPDDFEVWGSLGDAYRFAAGGEEQSRSAYRKAIELGERLLEINPRDENVAAPLAQYYANTGDAGRARELMTLAEAAGPDNLYVHYFAAVTRVSLGEPELALASIERAVELGYPSELLALDAGLGELRNAAELRTLLDDGNRE